MILSGPTQLHRNSVDRVQSGQISTGHVQW
jgi:hypothetical protein